MGNSSGVNSRRVAAAHGGDARDKNSRRAVSHVVNDNSEDEIEELVLDKELHDATQDFHHISINERGEHRILRPLSSKGGPHQAVLHSQPENERGRSQQQQRAQRSLKEKVGLNRSNINFNNSGGV